MKFTVLTDNNTLIDKYCIGEPGFCLYIEDNGKKILFDTGYSDVYVKNAHEMGVDLTSVDCIVFSHGHNDHTGGLRYLPERGAKYPVIACKDAFNEKKKPGEDIGSPLSKDELQAKFDLRLSDSVVKISDNILFLGRIPRTNDFENKVPIGQTLSDNVWKDDYLYDDSALVFTGSSGIYVISGCSHSGICNIVDYAKKVTGAENVTGVIGGFHLMNGESEQLKKTCEYFSKSGVRDFYPCHCTCFAAKAALNNVIPVKEVGAGLSVEWK